MERCSQMIEAALKQPGKRLGTTIAASSNTQDSTSQNMITPIDEPNR